MGQQQLLLLVIGIVIVAFAVLGGLAVYERTSREAEVDAMMQAATDLAVDLDGWFFRSVVFGGGGEAVCPFTASPGALGRPSQTGAPFAGNLPRYPAPDGGTWIPVGNGRFAQLLPASDIVRVVSSRHGDLSVELQVHGPHPACHSMRRRQYRDGAWQMAPHSDATACPRLFP